MGTVAGINPSRRRIYPGMPDKKKDSSEASDAALKARLAQLELENRIRLQKPTLGANPIGDTPRRGFGSAQGIAHLRHTEYQRRGPSPPSAPTPVPEPGKARFGGTYLRTPLPGIISAADATPGFELIAPVPATPTAPPPAAGPGKEAARAKPPGAGAPPGAATPGASASPAGVGQPAAKSAPPSGAMPSGRPIPGIQPAPPHKEAAQAKPAGPVTPPLEPGNRRVVAGGAVAKAPLPALYHAGMKAAEAAEKSQATAKAPAPATSAAMGRPAPELVIPEGVEVTKDAPKASRVKRFKNPTLAPKEPS